MLIQTNDRLSISSLGVDVEQGSIIDYPESAALDILLAKGVVVPAPEGSEAQLVVEQAGHVPAEPVVVEPQPQPEQLDEQLVVEPDPSGVGKLSYAPAPEPALDVIPTKRRRAAAEQPDA